MYKDLNKKEKEIVKLLSEEVGYDISNFENLWKIKVGRKVNGVPIRPQQIAKYIIEMLDQPASYTSTGDMVIVRAWDTIFVYEKSGDIRFTINIGPFSEHAFFTQGGEKYQVVPRPLESTMNTSKEVADGEPRSEGASSSGRQFADIPPASGKDVHGSTGSANK